MFKLIHEKPDNTEQEYEFKTEEEMFDFIRTHAKSQNHGYYYRHNLLEDGWVWLDYGSHTEFFRFKEFNNENN